MAPKAYIEPNSHVVLDYTLRDADDDVLDASNVDGGEPIIYVHGYGMLVPGLEKALAGLSEGEQKEIVVPPEEGFGDRDEEFVLEVGRSEMPRPEAVAVGDELVAESPDGEEAVMRVIEVTSDGVLLDGNHPLAGETLHYSVHVREVRPATEDEIARAAAEFDEMVEAYELPPGESNGAQAGLVQLGRPDRQGQSQDQSHGQGTRDAGHEKKN